MTERADLLDPAARRELGAVTGTEISGRPHSEPTTLLEESWRDFIYAEVWTRPGLDRRARYLIAMASAASSNGPTDRLDDYVRGAMHSGELALSELREAALHLAVYGGWSKGAELDAAVTRIAKKMGLPPVQLDPIRAEPWDADERTNDGVEEFKRVMTFGGPPSVTAYFSAGINNFVFGEMWCRKGLDQRSRRWITLVGVADSAAHIPIHSHVHAAMGSGNCTPEEMHEFVLQYAIHAGWPKASVVQGAVIEMAKKHAAGLAWNE